MARYRIGVDIGGTFTDFSVYETESGRVFGLKAPTIPHDPVEGLAVGLQLLTQERGVPMAEVEYFVHGTTIAVNTLIERKGARLALLVTKGFRDLLIIQRLHVPRPQYWWGDRPAPLIARDLVFEIDERLRADGSTHVALSETSVQSAVSAARAAGVQGLVVCFLHAFRNPVHEREARAIIEREAPDLFVCCSSEIWPRMREYERAIISIVNAYVMPRVAGYLGKLETRLGELSLSAVPYITQSNGGVMTARRARGVPAETLLSGPASGVIGAARTAMQDDIADIITLDIGGTSGDVAFVDGGRPQTSQSEHVADFPIMMPVVGVSSIGAGGGSLISLDDAGVLRIGPESAGSDPGPACYGRGSDRAALSDAFLAGGYLNPDTFAGGRVKLHRDLAEKALAPIAAGLATDLPGAVDGILQVTVASLYAELSNLAAQRGVDPRDYTLVSFGGAGSLLACRLAEELGVARVLVPLAPGTLCAMGALSADVASHFVRSIVSPLEDAAGLLAEAFRSLEREARAWLAVEAPALQTFQVLASADMRYVGQSFEVDVPLEPMWLAGGDLVAIAGAFHEMHRRVYAHADPSVAVEVVDLRLMIAGTMPKPAFPKLEAAARPGPAAPYGQRAVSANGGARDVPVWRRGDLRAGHTLAGPGLVDQDDTTVFVAAGWVGTVRESGNLLLQRTA